MYKACPKCGKIHDSRYKCSAGAKPIYRGGEERAMRSTYAWTQKSKEIREKAQYLCEVCRDQGFYTYDGLEVHHIVKVRDNKDLLLDNSNLVCLCKDHHKQAEEGLLSARYLKQLAEGREERYTPVG